MVDMGRQTLFYVVLVVVLTLASATLLESFISDIDPCEEVCQKTYPLHTYEKSLSGACCSRGCRLYSILELLGERVVHSVIARKRTRSRQRRRLRVNWDVTVRSLLNLGRCKTRPAFSHYVSQLNELGTGFDSKFPGDGMLLMPNPFMYMHSMYSSMLSQMKQHVSVSWSVFVQDGTGKMVIAKSKPQVFDLDLQGLPANLGTSSVMETNIEPVGSMATEMSRNSQLKSAKGSHDEINSAELRTWDDGSSNDWLTCIARKTGMPRLLLSVIMLLSAIALIWLCVSAAVTAPDHRLSQKLSIRSDLDYLQMLPDKGTKGVLPQDVVTAHPLPAKLVVGEV